MEVLVQDVLDLGQTYKPVPMSLNGFSFLFLLLFFCDQGTGLKQDQNRTIPRIKNRVKSKLEPRLQSYLIPGLSMFFPDPQTPWEQ